MVFKFKLFVDGACPGNPGPGGSGIVIMDENDDEVYSEAKFVGERTTNNVAEYTAMAIGLKRCADREIENLEVNTDSKLMVGQLGYLPGRPPFKVNAVNLQPLHAECKKQLKRFKKVHVQWIPRELNKNADRMANLAVKLRRDTVVEPETKKVEEAEEEEGTKRVKLSTVE